MTSPATVAPAQRRPIVSGLALLAVGAGVLLIVAGSHRTSIVDVLKASIKGHPIPDRGWYNDASLTAASLTPNVDQSGGQNSSSGVVGRGVAAGSGLGAQVAADALGYVGQVRYRWGGATPDGWDCSGFVTWVLHHDFGFDLPSNDHTVTGQFLLWSGARTVKRADMQPGDLVCWPGHIGIAVDAKMMVNANLFGGRNGTFTQPVDDGFPVIRRPLAYGS